MIYEGLLVLVLVTIAQCQKCQPPQVNDGRIYISLGMDNNGMIASGTSATLICSSGSVSGANRSLCQNGNWQTTFGSCASAAATTTTTTTTTTACTTTTPAAGACAKNINIQNGRLFATTDANAFVIQCNDGYDLKGPQYVVCLKDGTATKQGSCSLSTSGSGSGSASSTTTSSTSGTFCYSAPVSNGVIVASSVVSSDQGRYKHKPGSTIELVCNSGYQALGATVATCRSDGFWTTGLGICTQPGSGGSQTTTAVPTTTETTQATTTDQFSGSGQTVQSGGQPSTVIIWVDGSTAAPSA